ncbi:MAG: FadR/GntR family transcriptional regulator [Acidobacteria bacterium]|nr:FadR/GntR family transcriptional regulator [Acidobacteriota bacterium]
MATLFSRIDAPENLHDRVTRTLALRVIQADRGGEELIFPNEADLCQQIGVSRSILREAVKVLADKGMVDVRPRSGTRALPRSHWRLLDPDILNWQAGLQPDPGFLRDLSEVRLALEPTAAGFAAVRATPDELARIGMCLERREVKLEDSVDLELRFHQAVVAASHNPLLVELSSIIRQPYRMALAYTSRLHASAILGLAAHWQLFEAIRDHNPMAARTAAEEIVGLAMLALEEATRGGRRSLR